ncbi:MAG: DNA polymerase III subunit alpha [Acidobacteriota bacterium]
MEFVHLNAHSSYSKMEGVNSPQELLADAAAMGYKALALSDTNGLYGIVFFLQAAREVSVEAIVGSELSHAGRRALLLIKDHTGYSNLCRILSEKHCDPGFDLAQALVQRRDGLIVATDDAAVLARLRRDGQEDLYVELSPGYMAHEAYALARRTGLPPLATNRVRFIKDADYKLHRFLRAIALNTRLSRLRPADVCTERNYLTTPAEMAEAFPHAPHAIENTLKVAAACKRDWDFRETIFPAYRSLNDEEAYRLLRQKVFEGARRRYGETTPAVLARIEHELSVIREKRFIHYFLLVEDIVKESSLTCGRGSGAASIVSYTLRITDVDPIRHNLFFERFLNPGRVDPPDIDVDFAWDERDRILDYVFSKFTNQRCAMVANHPSLQPRAAIREVAKVYGMPDSEIGKITSRLARLWYEDAPLDAIRRHPLFKDIELQPPWPEILDVARRLNGNFRYISLHCGGVVIVPDEIRKYVPVEVAPKGLQVIQWEKDQAEDAGLVKIDLLGNRSLAVIRDAVAAVKRNYGIDLAEARWLPADDAAACRLIQRGETMGCFYIESPATRLLLQKMWGDNRYPGYDEKDVFEHVVMASSIIRPAANRFIQEFVRRMHGGRWRHIHPLLAPVLDETYGVMIYQEQVTQIAMAMAGFSPYDGDQLRKILTKKHRERKLRDYHEQFLAGARVRGVPDEVVREIWDQILSFSGYSFCKPHSASYAMVSFKSAYLRAHYPAEFIAAVISNQGGYYSTLAYVSEARRMGLRVLPPDVNESEIAYTGCRREVRVGLMQLKSLNAESADRVVTERRRNGPFGSFEEFLARVPIPPSDVKILIKAGSMDAFGLTRPAMMWKLHELRRGVEDRPVLQEGLFPTTSEEQLSVVSGQLSAKQPEPGGSVPSTSQSSRSHPTEGAILTSNRQLSTDNCQLSQYDQQTLLRHEIETLGFLMSAHPLDLHRDILRRLRYVPAVEMHRYVGQRVTMIGWLVTSKLVHTKRGEPMEFVSFEDTTALYETVFFPEAYRRFCHILSYVKPYVLRGKVDAEYGSQTLTVEWAGLLDDLATRPPARAGPSGDPLLTMPPTTRSRCLMP